jgi:hypothetical protein
MGKAAAAQCNERAARGLALGKPLIGRQENREEGHVGICILLLVQIFAGERV